MKKMSDSYTGVVGRKPAVYKLHGSEICQDLPLRASVGGVGGVEGVGGAGSASAESRPLAPESASLPYVPFMTCRKAPGVTFAAPQGTSYIIHGSLYPLLVTQDKAGTITSPARTKQYYVGRPVELQIPGAFLVYNPCPFWVFILEWQGQVIDVIEQIGARNTVWFLGHLLVTFRRAITAQIEQINEILLRHSCEAVAIVHCPILFKSCAKSIRVACSARIGLMAEIEPAFARLYQKMWCAEHIKLDLIPAVQARIAA